MNFYPYYNFPYNSFIPTPKVGGFKSLLGGIKWSSILNGTQKTLNVVNQAIPIIKQAGPVINNAKTMFKVMNEFKKIDVPITTNSMESKINETKKIINNGTSNGPTFFQ